MTQRRGERARWSRGGASTPPDGVVPVRRPRPGWAAAVLSVVCVAAAVLTVPAGAGGGESESDAGSPSGVVWSASLTVGNMGRYVGFRSLIGSVSVDSFVLGEDEVSVVAVLLEGDTLYAAFSLPIDDGLVLGVDGQQFAMSDAVVVGNPTTHVLYRWDDTGLGWDVGDVVELSLAAAAAAVDAVEVRAPSQPSAPGKAGDVSSVNAWTEVPASPTGLRVVEVDGVGARLSWNDPGDDSISGYRVLRRDRAVHGPGVFETIEEDTADADPAYVDATIAAGGVYVYRVIALNAAGAGPRSTYKRLDVSADYAPPPTEDPSDRDSSGGEESGSDRSGKDSSGGKESGSDPPGKDSSGGKGFGSDPPADNPSDADPTGDEEPTDDDSTDQRTNSDDETVEEETPPNKERTIVEVKSEPTGRTPRNAMQQHGTDHSLDSANSAPSGVWADASTIWVADDADEPNNKIFAYNRSDGSRDASKDISTIDGNGNDNPRGLWSDGDTMFVVDREDGKVYAYRMSDDPATPGTDEFGQPDSAMDITLVSANDAAEGLWGDADTIWVANDGSSGSNRVFAYDRSDGSEDTSAGFAATALETRPPHNREPRGIARHAQTMFVVDGEDQNVYAYSSATKAYVAAQSFALDPANTDAEGMAYEGDTLWVVDDVDDKLYAYSLTGNPAPSGLFVSNLGQPRHGTEARRVGDSVVAAQSFTTGTREGGYELSRVLLVAGFDSGSSAPYVSLRAATTTAIGETVPGSKLADLTAPSVLVQGAGTETIGNYAFTAPAGTLLSSRTDYFIVVEPPDTGAAVLPFTQAKTTAVVDSGSLAGWDIEPTHALSQNSGVSFGAAERALIMAVEGRYPVTQQDSAGSECASDPVEVPGDWALMPTGLDLGDCFRVLFVTSGTRDATSGNINDYNNFVQLAALAGHSAIRDYGLQFRAVASTLAVDAIDNTETTHTNTDRGAPIYWLGGNKVADDYHDFYDGTWDDEANRKDEHGNASTALIIWTGSNDQGEATSHLGSTGPDVGRPNVALAGWNPLSSGGGLTNTEKYPLYGISPVFQVGDRSLDICGRSLRVVEAILAATPSEDSCEAVSEAEMAAITDLPYQRAFRRPPAVYPLDITLKPGDFDELTGLRTLDLSDTHLHADWESGGDDGWTGLFDPLVNLRVLDLSNNQMVGYLPQRLFSELGSLEVLRMRDLHLWPRLPEGAFEGLGSLRELDLRGYYESVFDRYGPAYVWFGDEGPWNPRFGSPFAFVPLTSLETYNYDHALPYATDNYSKPPPSPENVRARVDRIPTTWGHLVTVTVEWDPPEGAQAAGITGYRVGRNDNGRMPFATIRKCEELGVCGKFNPMTKPEDFGRWSVPRARLDAGTTYFVDAPDRSLRLGASPATGSAEYWVSALTRDGESLPVRVIKVTRHTETAASPAADTVPPRTDLRVSKVASRYYPDSPDFRGFWHLEWDPVDDPTVYGYEIGYRGSADQAWNTLFSDVGKVTSYGYDIQRRWGHPENSSWGPFAPCHHQNCTHKEDREFRVRALNAAGAGCWSSLLACLKPSQDFNTLGDADNRNPRGLHVHDGIMYVPDNDDSHVYAYDLETKARVTTKDVELDYQPLGITGDGDTIWIISHTDDAFLAYDAATHARDTTRDIAIPATSTPQDICTDGNTLWATAWSAKHIIAYKLDPGDYGARDSARDITSATRRWRGCWTDGEFMLAVDDSRLTATDPVFVFDLSDGTVVGEIDLPDDVHAATGVWYDGQTTVWVADNTNDKILALTPREGLLQRQEERVGLRLVRHVGPLVAKQGTGAPPSPVDPLFAERDRDAVVTLTSGEASTGSIEDHESEHDWYQVALEAGEDNTYWIEVAGEGVGGSAVALPYIRAVFDGGGEAVYVHRQFHRRDAVRVQPTVDDRYYVVVRGAVASGEPDALASTDEPGTYTVTASLASDLPADTTTTGTVGIGSGNGTRGHLEEHYDVDWFRVELEAAKTYRIDMRGGWTGVWIEPHGWLAVGTLEDSMLKGVHDADGNLVEGSDNEVDGIGRDSRIENFSPDADGTYYIAAGAEAGWTGTFHLTVTVVE